ncbi:MAG: DUF4105 domain-containing protein [Halomonadaceae bacterium]|nr:MAG: DUF4105 domain-containing protein [Halomonadaceae bacterium]
MFLPLLLILLCYATPGVAAENLPEKLHEQGRWQALLHINQGTTWRNRGRSYVDDEAFFLNDQGQRDARSELTASARALAPAGTEARCRFPARYRFLKQQLDWPQDGGLAHCHDYLEWRQAMPDSRVVLVFPAAYLNSPSSMFGHTLLRIDSDRDEDGVWLSQAVNFGAAVGDDDNSILYVYRGLAGGYPGYFSIVPYVRKIQDYAHLENREMWEYHLNLNSEERAWLLDHLWELQSIEFDYLFLDENCSFRLLELIDLARPDAGLMSDFRMAEVPVDTVRNLQQAGFIAGREYRPSKAGELAHLIAPLDAREQRLALVLSRNPDKAREAAYQNLPEATRHQVARVAYEHLRLQQRIGERDPARARDSLALLQLINTHKSPGQAPLTPPPPPEEGHGTKLLSLAGGIENDNGFGELQYRMTYHDWLDNPAGFLEGAAIEVFNLRLRKTEQRDLQLEQLDLVTVRSLAPRNRFMKPVSWYVNGGLDRRFIEDKRQLTRQIQGGPGLSWRTGPVQPYVFAAARAENNSAHNPLVSTAAGLSTGALWYAKHFQLGLAAESFYFHNDDRQYRTSATINLPLGRHQALRASLQRDGGRERAATELRLAWRYYFD